MCVCESECVHVCVCVCVIQDLWCRDECASSKLLGIFHSEEEVEMADHNA